MTDARLPNATKVCYGLGQIAETLVTTGFTVFLLFFYNQVLALPGALTGLALAIALAVDAVTDPLIGSLSDRLHSRWGRRHPFMILSAAPLALSFFALFNPPSGLSDRMLLAWLTLFAISTRFALTLYAVPHLALGAELAHDPAGRSSLFSFNLLFGSIGSLFGGALALRWFFPSSDTFQVGLLDPKGYRPLSSVYATAIVAAIFVSAIGTRREIPRLPASGRNLPRLTATSFIADFASAFSNPSFRALFYGITLSAVAGAVESALAPYVGTHFWGLPTEKLAVLPIFGFVGVAGGMFLVGPVTARLDRKEALIASALVAIVAGHVLIVVRLIAPGSLPENGSGALLLLVGSGAFTVGAMGPLVFANLNAMFADIVDEHELLTGVRREGVVFSARTFVVKVAQSVGIILGGLTLDTIGFPRRADLGLVADEVLWRLGLTQGLIASLLTMLGVSMYAGYRLDRRRHAEILASLAERRA